jgi:hypothetical protein
MPRLRPACFFLVGGSGKDSNRITLGSVRTCVRLRPEDEFSYANWCSAVRAGRTFITNGPLIDFQVDGYNGVRQATPDTVLRITASARSLEPFDRLELLMDGTVIAATSGSGEPCEARIEAERRFDSSAWLAARCVSSKKCELYPHLPLFAHTSPTYVVVPERHPAPDPAAVEWLRQSVLKTRDWIEQEGRFLQPRSRAAHLKCIETALTVLDPSVPYSEVEAALDNL